MMRINLWNTPYNGGWVWFDRRNLSRCEAGRNGCKIWWAVFGFCGSIYLQTWPWQKVPDNASKGSQARAAIAEDGEKK